MRPSRALVLSVRARDVVGVATGTMVLLHEKRQAASAEASPGGAEQEGREPFGREPLGGRVAAPPLEPEEGARGLGALGSQDVKKLESTVEKAGPANVDNPEPPPPARAAWLADRPSTGPARGHALI